MVMTSFIAATAIAASTAGKLVAVGKTIAAVGTVITAVQAVADKISDK